MNFFEYQDKARSSTKLLVFLFACAVAALIVLTTLIAIFALGLARAEGAPQASLLEQAQAAPEIFLGVSIVVVTIVFLGALFRLLQLRGGGKAVAESLGGRLLNVQTRDADERKVLNVVEEMAIAAGVPVPQVYLLEDPAINAFAAGYEAQDAVIGITRGCIQQLTRDELQGVVAHEFSHILNGDMRLNIKLMGWLYGITVIGLIGYHLMRSMRYSARSSRKKDGGGLVLLGIGLVVVGYGGTFFGKLIKAAVSRQREFLADASAVQFTRNIGGIGGALKKIAANSAGSRITTVDTHEISHMLFGSGTGFAGWLATHPPIAQRIRRIDPQWDGTLSPAPARAPAAPEADTRKPSDPQQNFYAGAGLLTAAALAEARHRLQMLPAALHEAAHNTLGGCMLVFALLVSSSNAASRERQLQWLQTQLSEAHWQELQRILGAVAGLERKLYLPLVEVVLPALHELSAEQCDKFTAQLQHLIETDAEVSLFEWCLFRIVHSALVRGARPARGRQLLENHSEDSRVLLAALARAGSADEQQAAAAFTAGVRELDADAAEVALPALGDLRALDEALARLAQLEPLQKPRLLKALARCARADRTITVEEQELLRAIGAALDCPTPPLA